MNKPRADELAKECAAFMYERDSAAREAGITLHEVKPGYACVKMKVRANMLNNQQVCHGGFLFLLADTAFAYAGNSYNRVTYAQSCDIDFVKAGREGDELTAIAEERTRGGKTGLYDASVNRGDGEVLAYFRGRSYQVQGEVIQA